MEQQKYPQDEEQNEYRYISPSWVDAIACGLTAGAEKHPGETWHDIPAKEHAARAVRHLSMWLAGDRSDKHIINASMRCMMAWVMEQEESKKMREIKFRVWDSAGKQMCPVIVADFQDIKAKVFCRLPKSGVQGLFSADLMQYTGVKDKNGIEIYEGDIIRGHTGRYQVDCVVRWSMGNCGFIAEPTIMERTYLCLNPGSTKSYEVIGNIYENPELVSDETNT